MNKNLSLAKTLAVKLNLPLKIISVEENGEGILTFRFSSGSRVELRDLVRKLQEETKRKVTMQQMGSREEVRLLAGVGPCGQKLCCATFLKTLPVLPTEGKINEEKIGICGKPMCCLAFEEKAAVESRPQEMPLAQIVTKTLPQRILRVLPRKKSRHRR